MEAFVDWLFGRLSATGRIYSALWPMFLLAAYFVGGLLAYLLRVAIKGPYYDAEIQARGSSVLAGMWLRHYFAWVMLPIWAVLLRLGIPANALTTLSMLLAAGAGVACAEGRFSLGGWLYIFSGICDFFDGRIARITNTASPAGSALDSILDRYSDAAILVGLSWYYRDSWVSLATNIALVGSLLVPYVRAKAESLNVSMKEVGVAQRAERLLYLGVSVALAPIMEALVVPEDPQPIHRLAVAGIVLMAFSTQVTAGQRFYHLMRTLRGGSTTFRLHLGRGGVVRNAVAGVFATGMDFVVMVLLVQWSGFTPWLATAVGATIGGVVNFAVNRIWAFATHGPVLGQAGRYFFVSLSGMLLNAGGVAVMASLPALDYRVGWLLVRVAVFSAWMYPLFRDYVFVRGAAVPACDG